MIEVLAVVDTDGRQWSRLPEAWAENAPLCSASDEYMLAGGDQYIVWCQRPSVWTCGEVGFCGFHFSDALIFGNVKAARAGQCTGGFAVSESTKTNRRLAQA